MADVTTGVVGKTYLVTQEQFNQIPIGTKYMVLTDDPNVFGGKIAIVVSNDSPASVLVQIMGFGWEDAPLNYPSGPLLVEPGMIITLVTKELVDPLPEATDDQLIASMIYRGLHV